MVVRTKRSNLLLHFAVLAAGLVGVVDAAKKNYTSATDYENPTIGAELVHFRIATTEGSASTLACEDPGARCVFTKAYYSDVDFGDGQETSNGQGAVWAATVDSAVLTLGACTGSPDDDRNDCIVTCNANCTCDNISSSTTTTTAAAVATNKEGSSSSSGSSETSASSSTCTRVESRAPTMAPKTSPPVPAVCPKTQFDLHCPELMRTSLPAGIVHNYDCFNFCGGIWVSGCAFGSATCGILDCDNKTAVGSVTGQVFGCTKADFLQQATAPSATTNGGKKSSSSPRSSSLVTIMVLVCGMYISQFVL
jgi:hypothetical protein